MSDQVVPAMRVHDLKVELIETGESILKGVSFELHAGEIFALVGESGSGKSVTSLAAMRVLPNALRITGGAVHVGEQDLFELSESKMQTVRGQRVDDFPERDVRPEPGTNGGRSGGGDTAFTHHARWRGPA